jgi:16S rRNA (guanine527-N7)-methyltransferase
MTRMAVDIVEYAELIHSGCARMGLDPDATVCRKLATYLSLLEKWNKTYNLTSIRRPRDMLTLHLLDSLSVASHVATGEGSTLLDVGTGPGLPGIPLAIVYPHLPVFLLDSNIKKTRFLTQCKIELGLANVTVLHDRVEQVQGRFPQIISRAFASLEKMVEVCGHLLAPEGEFLAMKGQKPGDEMSAIEPNDI